MTRETTDVDATATVHRLVLDEDRRAAVIQQMLLIETLARRFIDFPLEPEMAI